MPHCPAASRVLRRAVHLSSGWRRSASATDTRRAPANRGSQVVVFAVMLRPAQDSADSQLWVTTKAYQAGHLHAAAVRLLHKLDAQLLEPLARRVHIWHCCIATKPSTSPQSHELLQQHMNTCACHVGFEDAPQQLTRQPDVAIALGLGVAAVRLKRVVILRAVVVRQLQSCGGARAAASESSRMVDALHLKAGHARQSSGSMQEGAHLRAA